MFFKLRADIWHTGGTPGTGTLPTEERFSQQWLYLIYRSAD